MRKFRSLLLLAFVGILTITLAACGQTATKSNSQKQTLNLSSTAPLDTIDISKSTGYGSTGNAFESFYRLGKGGKPTAGLAKSAKVSKDGKTWTFTLRNAKWSNGDKITAQDFVYSWRRTLKPSTKSTYAYLFSGIKNADQVNAGKLSPDKIGIKALNSKTVQIQLEKPIAYFKVLMAYPLFGPQNQKVVDKYGKKYGTNSKYMVYSGPFTIKNWNGTGNKWQFVKNNQYWDKSVVKLHKIKYTVVASPSTGLELYQQGKLDLTPLSNEQVKHYKNNKEFQQYPYSYIGYIKYNFKDANLTKRKAMSNKDIRLAISLAINREQLTKKVLGDGSDTPTGFVASGLAKNPKTGEDFAKEQSVPNTVDYNVKLAKQHWQKGLKALGTKNVTLTITSSNDDPTSSPITQYMKSELQKDLPGFKLNIRNVPGQVANQEVLKGDFDLSLSGWGADFNDPISFLQIPETGTSYNSGKYSNAAYDKLIKQAQNQDANNADKRWSDLVKAAKLFNADQGMTPLYQQVTSYLQKPAVKGIIHNTAGTQWSYKYAYMK
ncbi:peptide ABC transporter substrate-binding protein [Lentilactobacillus kefiri]|uniref:ABC transporter periplasmic protein n=3 Tax=Bacilli TaxID=91061 RepID=A0A8E1RHY0_LENKE|nr:peptide ABC transporter substrate-binding protein [Lentilactobacillus kefiri]KRL73460.1 ABC transporter periplasmic protein [Lentilactobacillus parakefiri DSM 10551]KRM49681.1 ABC transporter periplasmic protein [Lentilactobacillus kefiri DSM 20587 = JCM 5818]MCJ2162473.1 peptide ABC transporter substrate-binding protein [Lentilactobacillus kefiri]MCP9369703.1 peptide ABC transporter substrate-binding protein [Lentilactobacillus kefiri]MDM7493650.1 peptide ABC transporter substrate-binding 